MKKRKEGLELPKLMMSDYKVLHLPTDWTVACCDCGLTHKFIFSVDTDEEHLIVEVLRDDKMTSFCRRKKRHLFMRRKKKKGKE